MDSLTNRWLSALGIKHYFGITYSGKAVTRGIEIRRHDAPNFIKQFQIDPLNMLFDCKDSSEVAFKYVD